MVLQYILEIAKYKLHLSIFKGNTDLPVELFPCKYKLVGALSIAQEQPTVTLLKGEYTDVASKPWYLFVYSILFILLEKLA